MPRLARLAPGVTGGGDSLGIGHLSGRFLHFAG